MTKLKSLFDRAQRYWDSFCQGEHCGLSTIMPQVKRHFYIFHHIEDGNEPRRMLSKARLVYKIPFSDFQENKDYRKSLLKHVELDSINTDVEYISARNHHLAEQHNRLNRALEKSDFSVEINSTQIIHELLSKYRESEDNLLCFFDEYGDKLKAVLEKEKNPYDEGRKVLWRLEKEVLYNLINELTILYYPLTHNGVWFSTLCAFVEKKEAKKSIGKLLALSPYIGAKIYTAVYSQRRYVATAGGWDRWVCENLSRLAITNSLPFVHIVQNSIVFSTSKEDPTEASLLKSPPRGKIRFQSASMPVHMLEGKYKFRERAGGESKTALGELTLIEREFDEIVDQSSKFYARLGAVRKSATAAIMSRNMSHNLGSHALANSKLYESVGILGESGLRVPQDKIAGVCPGIDAPVVFSSKDVVRARSRLQAFNQYSQGRLDFIARKLSEDGDKPEPMFLVNDVLKGFMTQQVLLDTLLDDNGFNTGNIHFVIHGNDKRGNDKADYWEYADSTDGGTHRRFTSRETPQIEDVLVGVTGGVTGCHALYALIENLLRNAAKYSRPDAAAGLELHIQFLQSTVSGVEGYRLRLWENLTDDNGKDPGKIAATVRDGLSKDVIDEEGKPIRGGHGMQEMRLCAEYLAGNDWAGNAFRFPSDEGLAKNGDAPPDEQDSTYFDFLRASRSRKNEDKDVKGHKDLTKPALRAYSTTDVPEGDNKCALVYELLLPNPLLLGLVCVRQYGKGMRFGTACKPQDPCVRSFASLDEMGKTSPHFGLIIAHDAQPSTIKGTLAKVARVHAALPFRLLVVTPSEDDKKAWQEAITNASPKPERFYPAADVDLKAAIQGFDRESDSDVPILPYRRLHVICNTNFFPENDGGQTGACDAVEADTCMRLQSVGKDAWQQIVLAVYEQWIEAWKGRPNGDGGQWNLMIGFDRDAGQVKDRWFKPLQECKCAKGLLDVTIGALPSDHEIEGSGNPRTGDDGSAIPYMSYFTRDNEPAIVAKRDYSRKRNEWKSCLVFDNHGNVFSNIPRGALRFYHKFSGSGSEMTLFQLLETPPSEPFAFGFYLLGLLEGCLTNIVTLDERVADAVIINGEPFMGIDDPLGLLRSAGIHPLFSFDRDPEDPPDGDEDDWMGLVNRRFITPNLNGWMKRELEDDYEIAQIAKDRIQREGIRFGQNSTIAPLREFDKENATKDIGRSQGPRTPRHLLMDAIVIHEGITDAFFKDDLWQEGDHLRLYSLLPFVVRTSGRGRESRHLGQTLPFIELNVLSDSCYGSPNKIKLAKALLGASGELEKPEKMNV